MKEKFIKFLELHDAKDVFESEMASCSKTPYRTINELCNRVIESEEWIAESMVWKYPYIVELDAEWREICRRD